MPKPGLDERNSPIGVGTWALKDGTKTMTDFYPKSVVISSADIDEACGKPLRALLARSGLSFGPTDGYPDSGPIFYIPIDLGLAGRVSKYELEDKSLEFIQWL